MGKFREFWILYNGSYNIDRVVSMKPDLNENRFTNISKTIQVIEKTAFIEAVELIDHLKEELTEMQLGHEHNETNKEFRMLGDDYGYCCICSSKFGVNEGDYAKEALAKIKAFKEKGE